MEFSGKTAIITGAAAGIGRATAHAFAREGANVVLVDWDGDKLETVRADVARHGGKVLACACDVSDEEQVNQVAAKALDAFGRIDILVNNAGLWRCDIGPFAQSTSEQWKKKINVNILGLMYFARAVINPMLAQKYGRIINLGSVAGVYGNCNMVDYSMTKGAVIAFTRALAKEVAPSGITVNTVSPGNVKEENHGDVAELSFMGRSGLPEENADLICFLASDKAAYISGQNYQIDGCRKKM